MCVSRLLKRLGLGGPDGGDLASVISLLRMGVGVVPDPSRGVEDGGRPEAGPTSVIDPPIECR